MTNTATGHRMTFFIIASLAILGLALKQGVPTVILARMVGNIAIDALVGSIPGLGDLFDFVFKANRKNLDLIERFRQPDADRPLPAAPRADLAGRPVQRGRDRWVSRLGRGE